MSRELELWKRISKCEVPGLDVRIFSDDSDVLVALDDGDSASVSFYEGDPRGHRTAAMLVVDALEAAGKGFTRVGHESLDFVYWSCHFMGYSSEVYGENSKNHGGKEHLALLSLLAEVVEAPQTVDAR